MAALNTKKDAMEKITVKIFFKISNDDVGVARGTVCQEIRPGAGFKTGDFVEEKLGRLP